MALGAVLFLGVACGKPVDTANPLPDATPPTTTSVPSTPGPEPSPTVSPKPTDAPEADTPQMTVASAPAAPGTVLYSADWSEGLDGWSGSEHWVAVGGELQCTGEDNELKVGAAAPADLEGIRAFAVEAEIRLLRYNVSNGSFGLMVRVQPDGTGYAAGHHPVSRGGIVLRTEKGGSRTVLYRQPFPPDDGWHTYRVEVRDNDIRIFVDGAQVRVE